LEKDFVGLGPKAASFFFFFLKFFRHVVIIFFFLLLTLVVMLCRRKKIINFDIIKVLVVIIERVYDKLINFGRLFTSPFG
jgi:hypothetical protein